VLEQLSHNVDADADRSRGQDARRAADQPVFRGGLRGPQARHLLALSGRRRDDPIPRRIAAVPEGDAVR